jgi:D-3-phosphoglycerate dehydrogenase
MKTGSFLIFDFDSTVIKLESLEEIAGFALEGLEDREKILEEISRITALGMEGKITFNESLRKRMSLFEINQKHLDLANEKILRNISDSFLANVDFIRNNAEKIYIISGGFDSSIFPVAEFFGLDPDHILANKFIFDQRGRVLGVDENSPLLLPQGKSLAVSNLKLDGNIVVIGDGYTDYQIKRNHACHHFIAFCENVRRESVVEKADSTANSLDDVIRLLSLLA